MDMNPTGYTQSTINHITGGAAGGLQVAPNDLTNGSEAWHALIWAGTAASVMGLNPLGYSISDTADDSNGLEVGCVNGIGARGHNHATIWYRTSGSILDLQDFLSAGFSSSTASAIAPDGRIFGTAVDLLENSHSMMWTPFQAAHTD